MKQRKFVIEEAQILGTNYQEILRTLALKFFKVPQRRSESYLAASPFLLTSYNIVPGYGGGNFWEVIRGKEVKMENNNAWEQLVFV